MSTSKETREELTVYESMSLSTANNGADAHNPSTMSLPSPGHWRLDAYIGEKLFGSVVVQVFEKK
jgi:hypothetical protein